VRRSLRAGRWDRRCRLHRRLRGFDSLSVHQSEGRVRDLRRVNDGAHSVVGALRRLLRHARPRHHLLPHLRRRCAPGIGLRVHSDVRRLRALRPRLLVVGPAPHEQQGQAQGRPELLRPRRAHRPEGDHVVPSPPRCPSRRARQHEAGSAKPPICREVDRGLCFCGLGDHLPSRRLAHGHDAHLAVNHLQHVEEHLHRRAT
jgi:hypothetical protein